MARATVIVTGNDDDGYLTVILRMRDLIDSACRSAASLTVCRLA
jgi:hypothetical protein